jgi:restriction endonuclease S subunit
LSGGKLATVEISVPSIETQVEVVKKIDEIFLEIEKAKTACYKKISELDILKDSLLNKAFNDE